MANKIKIMGLLAFNSTSFSRIKKIYCEFIFFTNSAVKISFLDLFLIVCLAKKQLK